MKKQQKVWASAKPKANYKLFQKAIQKQPKLIKTTPSEMTKALTTLVAGLKEMNGRVFSHHIHMDADRIEIFRFAHGFGHMVSGGPVEDTKWDAITKG